MEDFEKPSDHVREDRLDDPASDWHWEPKEAFRAVARRYGRHG